MIAFSICTELKVTTDAPKLDRRDDDMAGLKALCRYCTLFPGLNLGS